jgi:hemerythrin-like domain-containing protein
MTIRTIEIIRDEHQALAAMLRSLSMLLAHARRHGAMPDFDVLRAMLFYIDEFPERLHHPKETALLFPVVRTRAPETAAVLDRLDADHARGEQAIRSLEHALLAFEVMGPSRREVFEGAVQRYIAFYLEHMALEEEVVLPAARAADPRRLGGTGRRLRRQPRPAHGVHAAGRVPGPVPPHRDGRSGTDRPGLIRARAGRGVAPSGPRAGIT